MTDLFQFAERQSHMGRFLRDKGMSQAKSAQERDTPGWCDAFYNEIVRLARIKPFVHANDLDGFPKPEHGNAAGPVWMKVIRDQILERTDRVAPCSDPLRRKHQSPVYRSLICGGA